MKSITPNYVNDLTDVLASCLERIFTGTQLVIRPEVVVSTMHGSQHDYDGVRFDIRALLRPTGSCHRLLFLKLGGDGLDVKMAAQLKELVQDLKTVLPSPSPDEVPDAQADDPQH